MGKVEVGLCRTSLTHYNGTPGNIRLAYFHSLGDMDR